MTMRNNFWIATIGQQLVWLDDDRAIALAKDSFWTQSHVEVISMVREFIDFD